MTLDSIQATTERHRDHPSSSALHFCHLILLEKFLLLDAATKGAAIGAFFLGECGTFIDIILSWAVKLFLEYRVLVDGLELGLEVA